MRLAAGNPVDQQTSSDGLAALKRFAGARPDVERCELCGAALDSVHPHLFELEGRRIRCSCDACAILFCGQDGARYLRVPRRVRAVDEATVSELQWEDLPIPIRLAFFYRNQDGRITAMYPGAAGAVEGLVSLECAALVFEQHLELRGMAPLVEALLVNRVGEKPTHLIVPIDECYRLTGILRSKWRGLSGGTEVWGAIRQFLEEMERRAEPAAGVRHA